MQDQRGKVLIIEDMPCYYRAYKARLDSSYNVDIASDPVVAISKVIEFQPDVVILDLRLPPNNSSEDGLSLLSEILQHNPRTKVIVVTVERRIDKAAMKAIELGAYDFIEKGSQSYDELPFRVKQAYEKLQLEIKYDRSREERVRSFKGLPYGDGSYGPGRTIVGTSEKMNSLYRQIEQIAPTDATVLISGETGTGKTLIAQAIHFYSKRANAPFVVVDCPSVPENLFEDVLFGHEKGSYTGADSRLTGKFENANTGTVFIDEIAEIPLSVQAKFLRVIQEGEIERIGSKEVTKIDVRVIAATNRNINEAVKGGKLRSDLMYRLSTIPMVIPPLRERKADIPVLAKHFLSIKSEQHGKPKPVLEITTLEALNNHDWPGNIRELEKVIERAVILDEDASISLDDISLSNEDPLQRISKPLPELLEDYERSVIHDFLMKNEWNIAETARALGIPDPTLRSKIKRLGLQNESRRIS